MARGCAPARIDDKGRLKVPAEFRTFIELKQGSLFFVTSRRGTSAHIYPIEAWERFEQRLSEAPSMSPAVSRLRKAVNYFGQTAAMDGQGRILIHPLLRDRAEIRGDVIVLGIDDHLEVWNRSLFERDFSPPTDEDEKELSDKYHL